MLVGAPENGAALKVQPFQLIMSESRVGSGLWCSVSLVSLSVVVGALRPGVGRGRSLRLWRLWPSSWRFAFRLSGSLAPEQLVSAV